MNWFQGSIPEAIGAAKADKGLFVVFVYDDTDASKSAIEVMNLDPVSTLLSVESVVAIQLEKSSIEAQQFGAIYPLILVPSLFFINGNDGRLIEVIAGPFQAKILVEKIGKIISTSLKEGNKESAKPSGDPVQECATTNQPKAQPSTSSNEEQATQALAAVPEAVLAALVVPSESVEDASSSLGVALTDRIERAQSLASNLQRAKQLDIEEDERLKEVERRKSGQNVAKVQKEIDDANQMSYARQRKKDKEEDKLARERVKSQIAADRADREARRAILRGELHMVQQQPHVPIPANIEGRVGNITRIKFRLPDGSSILAQFDSQAKLSALADYLRQSGLPAPIIMCSSFHPKLYMAEELDHSLIQLNLAPSAIIMVKSTSLSNSGPSPNVSGVVASTGIGLYSMLILILAPFITVYNYLLQVFGLDGQREQNDDSNSRNRQDKAKRTQKGKKTFRQDGNIHRLGNVSDNDDDDDDDNNTWNGNSTQQM